MLVKIERHPLAAYQGKYFKVTQDLGGYYVVDNGTASGFLVKKEYCKEIDATAALERLRRVLADDSFEPEETGS